MGETEAETQWAEVGEWEMEWEVPAGGKAGEGTTVEGGGDGPLMLKGKRMGWEKAGLCFSRRHSDSSRSFLSRSLAPRMA